MKNLIYISPRDVRKNRADPVHIMKSCAAFAMQGIQVTLVTPRVVIKGWDVGKSKVWELYGIKPLFKIVELPTLIIEGTWLERTLAAQRLLWFGCYFVWRLLKQETLILYSKCYTSVLPAILLKKIFRPDWTIIFEKPDWDPKNPVHRHVCRRVDGIVAANEFIRKQIQLDYAVARVRTHVLSFYSDLTDFTAALLASKWEARKALCLPADSYLVLYTGKISVNTKEIAYILEAAALQPDKIFVLVGANEQAMKYYEQYCKQRGLTNVILRGFQNLNVLFQYQQAADLLVSYYESDFFSAYCRVPSKLTVYVCAQRPIILADLPSQRAILSDDLAFYVKPDSPVDLANGIAYLSEHPQEANSRAQKLFQFAQANSLSSSVEDTLQFIERVRLSERMLRPARKTTSVPD